MIFQKINPNIIIKNKFNKKPLSVKLLTLILSSSIIAIVSDWIINNMDRGPTEFFQEHLLFWCGILSFCWVIKNKSFRAISIPFIYIFLSLDESYSFHDKFSNNLFPIIYRRIFSIPNQYISPIDEGIGEFVYWGSICLLFIFISLPAIKSNIKSIRSFLKFNFAILFALSFFEIFIDFIYLYNNFNSPFLRFLFTGTMLYVEEIGSTITLAFAFIKLFDMNIQNSLKH